MESTYTKEQVDKIIKKFVWGEVTDHIEIGDILILKYIDNQDKELAYHPYVDGCDLHHTFHALEDAIIQAIAMKYDGGNSQAGMFFHKMIGM